jgi:hypothetical protein
MRYAIYPPIGLARLGNSDAFFVGSETRRSFGTELNSDGTEAEVKQFKDNSYRVKRQASRFRIFEVPDDGTLPRQAQLPNGTTVRWSVQLVNKKDAIQRPTAPPDVPTIPQLQPGREDRIIDSQVQTISGQSAQAVTLAGTYKTINVFLGELRTDGNQRLLVLGGIGKSESPSGAPIGHSFYNNPDWHDDVADGPVTATITLPGGTPRQCTPAWVIVAPPDFAPSCQGIVTLYDVILQVALDQNWSALPARPSFVDHIRPMLERTSNLRWVNNSATWPLVSNDWTALGDPSAAAQQLRELNKTYVLNAEQELQNFSLRDWQKSYLEQWAAGNFDPDSAPDPGPAASLTRAVLDGSVGQGFFPGIEAGIIVQEPSLYSAPFDFRFDHAKLKAGDLTALMALPWQADFLKCNSSWWPAQRPDVAPQANGARPPWLRPAMNHRRLAADVMKLGVNSPQLDGSGRPVVLESGRDPQLGQ